MSRGTEVLKTVDMPRSIPHNYVLWTELDGDDVWVGTSKGLARGIGDGYYPRLKPSLDLAEADRQEPKTAGP